MGGVFRRGGGARVTCRWGGLVNTKGRFLKDKKATPFLDGTEKKKAGEERPG